MVFAYLGGIPEDVLLGWVWRIPFLASILLILVALFIRMRLRESPTFIELEKQEQIAEHPLKEIFGALAAAACCAASGCGWPRTVAPTCSTHWPSPTPPAPSWSASSIGPIAVAVGSLIGMVSVPLAGHISDRVGRIPVYRFGAVVLLVLAFPGWYLISLGNAWLVIVVIAVAIGFGVNTMLGAQCALLPELFGNKHRYLGVAISREFSAVIAGGLAGVLGAVLIAKFDGSWVPLGDLRLRPGGHHLRHDLHHPRDRGRGT